MSITDRVAADMAAHPHDRHAERAARMGLTTDQVRAAVRYVRARSAGPASERPRREQSTRAPDPATLVDAVARQIATLLRDRNWTQARLARELEVSPGLVSAWMNGRGRPGATLQAVLDGLSARSPV